MDSIFFSFFSVIALVIISGFFAGAETAITGVSQATIHRLKQEGNKRAKIVSNLRNDKEKLISALLLGNTSCNTFASFLSASMSDNLFGDEKAWMCGVIMAMFIFVFAEVLPKSYAFENSEKFSLATAPILAIIVKILYPVVTTVEIVVSFVLSIFKSNTHRGSLISATDELRGAIDLHHHEGAVVKSDRDMLGSILDLRNTSIAQVMVHRSHIFSININSSIQYVLDQALISNHTRIPLWEDNADNIIGVLNIKDLLKAISEKKGDINKINIRELITPPWYSPENTTLSEQLAEFRKKRNHFSLVIDEYGDLLGLVTLENILEEIVGRIDDEHDLVRSFYKLNEDGSYLFEGATSIRDLNRELDWNLPADVSSTIAGLIMHETEKVPEISESFTLYGIKFTIVEKHYNQIKLVNAEILHQDA
jgi:Mg2+/Co2+ transporter CorB